ncbi:unnamed protein product [Bursaphelenchus okinawaensis]|uniref:non-specific serine/threonine protein kinase n=1 Tax=Bursaphelenchus okinawaensis TaxID=465554 RepID=A0A811KAF6_9BILA|nr:unnamed protein product [Bursaphelenchus okinawaensis]CAG9099622.1 unnamed protein product [Bursaphelenchus okinawaensis]
MLKLPGIFKHFPGYRTFQVLYRVDRMKDANSNHDETFHKSQRQLSLVKYNIPPAFQEAFHLETSPQKVVKKLVCASLVDSLVQLAPLEKKEVVKKAVVAVLSRAGVFTSVYMSEDLQSFRSPLTQVINSFVNSTASFFPLSVFSPRVDASLSYSVGEFSIVSRRYCQDFEEISAIGCGGFGRVYKVKSRLDGHFYAIKKILLRSAQTDVLTKTVKECKYHATFEDPHIVKYHNAWVELQNVDDATDYLTVKTSSNMSEECRLSFKQSEDTDSLVCFTNGTSKSKVNKHGSTVPERDVVDTDSISTSSSSDKNLSQQLVIRRRRNSDTRMPGTVVQGTYPILFIQMELCHATLATYLVKRNQQKIAEIDCIFNLKVIKDVVSAIDFLHDRNVIHRDIKPSNVFLKKFHNGQIKAMIGDFGLTIGHDDTKDGVDDFLVHPFPSISKRTKGVGTAIYAAPEQLNSNNYDVSADIYSLGIVIYEIFQVFKTDMERVSALKNIRKLNHCSEAFTFKWPNWTELIDSMVNIIASQRPSAKQILSKIREMEEVSENDRLKQQLTSLQDQNQKLLEMVEFYQKLYGTVDEVKLKTNIDTLSTII